MIIPNKHIVVTRFSALGDVAMVVPVLRLLLENYPEVEITMVTTQAMQPLFSQLPRCSFFAADLKGRHKGAAGMYRLLKELRAIKRIDAIADLHQVIRTNMLGLLARLTGITVKTIDKGREDKKLLTQRTNKRLQQLPTSFERYAAVFGELGYPLELNTKGSVLIPAPLPAIWNEWNESGKPVIGIAPFAFHPGKMYPLEKMFSVIKALSHERVNILLFGGGHYEKQVLQEWEEKTNGRARSVAGKFTLEEELAMMARLRVLVSMDSANMHLASLMGTPVISIWGATHPFAGFYGWGQETQSMLASDLPCRPCSVFGNKPCYRGDHACMHAITPDEIIQAVHRYL